MFSNKHKKVITAIINFYNGKISELPYTSKDVNEAYQWYKANHPAPMDKYLEQKILMAEKLLDVK